MKTIEAGAKIVLNEVKDIFLWGRKFLKDTVAEPEADAAILISDVLKMQRHEIYLNLNRKLKFFEKIKIKNRIRRRKKFEPVAYILNKKEFYSSTFYVNKNVFIPRPETELLIDEALNLGLKNGDVLDLGTGSGCIAIVLQKLNPSLRITAVDISKRALNIARYNEKNILGVRKIKFIKSNYFSNIKNKFDLIISNPAYIRCEDIINLARDIKDYEPRISYDGGPSGMDAYRIIIKGAKDYLKPGGYIILELNEFTFNNVLNLTEKEQIYKIVKLRKDFLDKNRVLVLMLSDSKA